MTDPRTDRFERELRAVLGEPVGGPIPVAIGELLARLPDAEPVRGRTVIGRWLGGRPGERQDRRNVLALGGLGALAVAVIVVAVAGGPLLRGLGTGGAGAGAGAGSPAAPGVPVKYRWDSGTVVMTVVDGRILANGGVFLVAPGPIQVHSDPGNEKSQTLELTWKEDAREMRLFLYFAADEQSWWVRELSTYNGAANGDWLSYSGPLFRTPLGQAFLGDVDLVSDDRRGRVTLTGVRIEPFRVGRVHLDPANCKSLVPPADSYAVAPLDPGQPLAGSGLDTMTPQAANGWLAAAGLCIEWRFLYRIGDDPRFGYSEVWCVPPPDSRITDISYSGNGNALIFTEPLNDTPRPVRPQPPAGWGC